MVRWGMTVNERMTAGPNQFSSPLLHYCKVYSTYKSTSTTTATRVRQQQHECGADNSHTPLSPRGANVVVVLEKNGAAGVGGGWVRDDGGDDRGTVVVAVASTGKGGSGDG